MREPFGERARAVTEERLRLLQTGPAPLAAVLTAAEMTGPLGELTGLGTAVWQGLLRGETWFVDAATIARVGDLATQRSRDLLVATEVPAFGGFMLFERPIMTLDRHGLRLSFRAIAWGVVATETVDEGKEGEEGTGLGLILLGHGDDKDDFSPGMQELEEELGDEDPDLIRFFAGLYWSTLDFVQLGDGWEVQDHYPAAVLAAIWRLVREFPKSATSSRYRGPSDAPRGGSKRRYRTSWSSPCRTAHPALSSVAQEGQL